MLNIQNSATKKQCPNCRGNLYFSPDGRFQLCEQCDFKRKKPTQRLTARELAQEQRVRFSTEADDRRFRTHSGRLMLQQGIAAVKAGDKEEGFYHLARLIRAESSEKEQAQAWLWLSELYEEHADKQECLEQVLALEPMNGTARRGMAILEGRLKREDIIDPNQLPAEDPSKTEAAQAKIFRCPRCDGHMNFSADRQQLVCEFCGFQQTPEEAEHEEENGRFGEGPFEQDFTATLATAGGHVTPTTMRELQCSSCAVSFILAPETLSVTCPYCDSVYVTETAESRELLAPQALVPFGVEQGKAELMIRRWFKQHSLQPTTLSPIIGIYLPLWTFDIGGELKWNGLVKRGDDWVPRSGSKLVFFDDVLVPAGDKLPDSCREVLAHFDLTQLVAYEDDFLAAWPAERYQLPLSDASLRGRKQVLRRLRKRPQALANEYVSNLKLGTSQVVVESYKLILLPLWVAHYKVDGQLYDLVVDGQNGRLFGDRPRNLVGRLISWLKG